MTSDHPFCVRAFVCVCVLHFHFSIWFILSFWQHSTWIKILSPSSRSLDHFNGAMRCRATAKNSLVSSIHPQRAARRKQEKNTPQNRHRQRWQPANEKVWCGVEISRWQLNWSPWNSQPKWINKSSDAAFREKKNRFNAVIYLSLDGSLAFTTNCVRLKIEKNKLKLWNKRSTSLTSSRIRAATQSQYRIWPLISIKCTVCRRKNGQNISNTYSPIKIQYSEADSMNFEIYISSFMM